MKFGQCIQYRGGRARGLRVRIDPYSLWGIVLVGDLKFLERSASGWDVLLHCTTGGPQLSSDELFRSCFTVGGVLVLHGVAPCGQRHSKASESAGSGEG